MAEKNPPHVKMLKGLRLNQFNEQLYFPEVEMTTKGKHKGKFRFNWSAKFILPPKESPEGKALLTEIKEGILAAKVAKWGDKAEDIKIRSGNLPYQDGDHEDVTFAAHKGAYILSASKTVYGQQGGAETDVPKRPFRIIGARKVRNDDGELKFPDMKPGEEGAPYSGCKINLKVEFWGQDPDGERGIPHRANATILAVQFKEHGPAFGGGTRTNVDDEFDDEDGDDDLGGGTSSSDDDDDDAL